ncbi:T9SS type B sorting domain-containing protein [Marinoscillum furvescens]|uniref:Gliding motility-associated-like protein n=1 Tax=Marinoscillum furvescens DSM 4134 TaxID=1122208 RepID=A0A3D9L5F2_MARFU|nr:gliding motility-associated C-terminal domain-containing protein [Marinoscillum furvescens]REE01253.1 gliding motility-associated-like protein [Marinoscillum furvescens DSM 4134]
MKKLIPLLLIILSFGAHAQDWNFSLTVTNETCYDAGDGSIDITMSGNISGFNFTWSVADSSDLATPIATGSVGSSSPDLKEFLPDGGYAVTITKDLSTEERTKGAVVGGSTTALTVTKTIVQQNICAGDASGEVQASASGGTPPYEYGLGFGAGAVTPNYTGGFTDNGGLFENLAAATYRVFVRDAYGCDVGNTGGDFQITQPSSIQIQYDTINANCNNEAGLIEITSIAGGTPFDPGAAGPFNYTVEWFDADGTQLTGFDNEAALNGLDSGEYSVTITDKNGCTGVQEFQIFKGFNLEVNSFTNISCTNAEDGEIQVRLDTDSQDDEAPFSLRIYDGNDQEIVPQRKTGIEAGNTSFSGLGPDTYRIEAEGNTGCVLEVSQELTEPSAPKLDSATMSPVICRTESTGSITFYASGGTGNYRYSVDGGANYYTSPTISGITAGTYDLWIQDDNNCPVDVADITVTEPLKEWGLVEVSQSDITCNGAGNGSYTFEFDTSKDTDPVVEDDNIVWKDRDSGEVIATGVFQKDDLEEGAYRIEVTANSGCYRELNFDISEPAALEILGDDPQFECPASLSSAPTEINVNVTGGTSPYTFEWKKNGGALSGESASNTATSSTLSNISDDLTYTVIVTDGNGCDTTRSFNISIPAEIEITLESAITVACKGELTGAIDMSVTGGTPLSSGAYNFDWSKDGSSGYAFTEDLSDLGPGEYQLTVRDLNDCEQVADTVIEITEPATTYEITGTVTNVVCNGDANGSIDVTIDRDAGDAHPDIKSNITWTKDGVAFPEGNGRRDLTGLAPGEYVITTEDEVYGCVKSKTFTVVEFSELLLASSSTQNECFNDANGEISIAPSGGYLAGGSSYQVRWYKNNVLDASNNDALTYSSLTDGTYRVEVTDDMGCEKSETIKLQSPDELVATASITHVACKGESTGALDVTITGGVTPYELAWTKDGATLATVDEDLSDLEAGAYALTITDANDCVSDTYTFNVTEPSTTYSISAEVTPVICNGANDGAIDLTVTRTGSPQHPFPDIFWTKDGVAFAENVTDINNLEPATYAVTVEDEYGCVRTASYEVEEYPELDFNATVVENECDGDAAGSITLDINGGYLGGNAGYTIRWYKGGTVNGLQNDKTSWKNLEDAIYRVVIADSVGCSRDTTITLSAPEPIAATASVQDIKCKGEETGYIALEVSGGTAPYSILWKKNNALGEDISTEDSIYNLAPGDYYVQIDDANDCDAFTATYTISEPATVYQISLNPTEIQCVDESNGALELSISADGGHPDDYTVSWTRNGVALFSEANVTVAAGSTISDLDSAVYEVTVQDANGCERTASYTMDDPDQIYFRPEITPVTCNGYSDGGITLDPTGGYGNFTVKWESQTSGTLADTDFDLANIPGDKYTVTLTDEKGCAIDTIIFVDDPAPIVVNATITDPKCTGGADGAISIEVSNGTPPYSYRWLLDDRLISTEQNISELVAGTYELEVTDQQLCTFTANDYIVSDPPSDFSISGVIDKVTCFDDLDGAIDVTIEVTGAAALEYDVYWEKDGELFSQNSEDLSGIGAGSYELFVEDQYGCIKSTTFEIENPSALALEFAIENVLCYDGNTGSVSVQVSGGYGDYTYSWQKDGEAFENTSSFANNLEAAFYKVTVEDKEGCTISRTVEVTQPDPFVIALTSQNNTCATPYDAEIDATVSGGVPPYKLQWFKDGLPYSKEEDLSAIPAGVYQLTATDSNFCETASVEVTITAPEPLGISVISKEDNLCPNTENGSLSVQGTGGSFPYTYSFDSAAFSSVNNYVNLAGRDYLLEVKDDVGCTYDTLIRMRNQYELEAEFSIKTEEFAIDFPITLTDESLGEGLVSWFWNFGDTRASEEQNTEVIYETPGTYAVTLTVENEVGCTMSKTDTLEIIQGYNFAVPTAFTPNGDGRNENFRPGFKNVTSLVMRVQNRNGQIVYSSDKLSASWDGTFSGKDVPQGSYYYEITYTAKSGVTRKASGKIFLMR